MSIDIVLNQRQQQYGDFYTGVALEATIMDLLKDQHVVQTGNELSSDMQVMFSKVVMKLVRAAVSPEYIDHWTDIAGYATLVERHLKDKQNA